MSEPILQLKNILKVFPNGVVANRGASLTVKPGTIHAVVGENGAGKTTLMNILYGLYQPDAGEIWMRGKPVQLSTPRVAKKYGIGMVHQHFMLVPSFTVLQNIILGYEPQKLGVFIDVEQAAAKVEAICNRYHLRLPLHAPLSDLTVGMQQRVEIIKAIYRGAETLILDEPTAVLTPQEVEEFFNICREMVKKDKTILFISHKLREVLALADQVTVMRHGETIATLDTATTSEEELACLIVGREHIWSLENRRAKNSGDVALRVDNLFVRSRQQTWAVNGLSMDVRAGEILGIAGVEGNGQSELMGALAGLEPVENGAILYDGQNITARTVAQRRILGIRHIPEDRMQTGLCLKASIAENMIIDAADRKQFLDRNGFLHWKDVIAYGGQKIDEYRIVAPDANTIAVNLSGGNLQKVVAARELSRTQKVLLVLHPTRGLDIGASEFIYAELFKARDAGCAILLVSADLDEIFLLSDRIAVIYEGRIVAQFEPAQVTKETVGMHMTGVGHKAAGAAQ